MAAHQIALTCATTTFMVPLGLSIALTIRVGHAVGAQEKAKCVRIILGTVLIAVGAMVLSASSFFFFGEPIADLFTNDVEVIAMAAAFLVVTGIRVNLRFLVLQWVDKLQGAQLPLIQAFYD